MIFKSIARQILRLGNKDIKYRDKLINKKLLSKGYDPGMEAIHIHNAMELETIITNIGYPTADKVGKEASEMAWMIVQHAISLPEFMKKCLALIEKEVENSTIDPIFLVYLSDRIAVLQGRNQLYGTQYDWDDNGDLSPNPYDDIAEVNRRREAYGLDTIEARTIKIRNQAQLENQLPPTDLASRKIEMEEWKKKRGWIL